MSGLTLWFTLLGAEIALVLLGVLTFAWLRSRKLRRRDLKAMQTLVAKVKRAKAERKAAIRQLLSERFKLSGDPLEASTSAVLYEEMRLYQQFANLYAKRDARAAMLFDIAVEASLVPYWTLPEQASQAVDCQAEPAAVDTAEIERLSRENQELRDELQVTMDAMTRILDEYATLFGPGLSAEEPTPGERAGSAAEMAPVTAALDEDRPPVGVIDDLGASDPSVEPATAASRFEGNVVAEELTPGSQVDPVTLCADQLVGTEPDAASLGSAESAEVEPVGLEELPADNVNLGPTVTDADADALLADALGEADLAVDELDDLDDLFDDEDLEEPDDLDNDKSVCI